MVDGDGRQSVPARGGESGYTGGQQEGGLLNGSGPACLPSLTWSESLWTRARQQWVGRRSPSGGGIWWMTGSHPGNRWRFYKLRQDRALHNSQAWKENSVFSPPHNLYLGKRCLFWKKTLRGEGEWAKPSEKHYFHELCGLSTFRLSVIVTEFLYAALHRATVPGEGGGPSRWLRMHASSDQRALLKTEILSVFIVSLPWLWYFVFRDSCPNRIWSFLFFKPSFEYFFNVIHAKRTDCGTRNAEKEERHQGTADLFWVPANKTQSAFWSAGGRFSPVELCGEHPYHRGNAIDLYYVCNRLQNIKVEKGISGDRTVKPSLQKRSPVLLQDALGATHVVFTYAGHTWINSLPRGQKQGDRIMSMEGEQEQKAPDKGGTKNDKRYTWFKRLQQPSL